MKKARREKERMIKSQKNKNSILIKTFVKNLKSVAKTTRK